MEWAQWFAGRREMSIKSLGIGQSRLEENLMEAVGLATTRQTLAFVGMLMLTI